VNVVRVWETKPPQGQPAVEWILLTTEPVTTKKQLLRIVDIYCKRWMIEDFFKALKTGCSLEKRQIESYSAMRKVLSLLAPLAYKLLLLRGIQRRASMPTPVQLFDAVDLMIIGRAQPVPRPAPESLDEALALLARMGGHLKNNGPPGWMTLGAGYEKLLFLKLGYHMGRNSC
jgi:hypothetical protein